MSLKTTLQARLGVRSLLSAIDANPKVAKNSKQGILTGVLHLAPGNMSGHEVCPKRSPGCTAACLHFAGSPAYAKGKDKARIARTRALFQDRNSFMNLLVLEMLAHIRAADQKGMTPAFRLNATSDIVWEAKKFTLFPEVQALVGRSANNIIDLFPTLQFYDYTAIPNRKPKANYHLTFSRKEQNMNDVLWAVKNGLNIAAVYTLDAMPTFEMIAGQRYEVIDGDETDYRPGDPTPCIVGLKVIGFAGRADQSGFIQRQTLSPGESVAA